MMNHLEFPDRPTLGSFTAMASQHLARAWKYVILVLGVICAISVGVALVFPRDFVASMVIVPVESSFTDATSQLLSTGISLRSAFSLGGGPPPQMAAFLATLKSPELAKYLAQDTRARAAILTDPGDINGSPARQTAAVRKWLDRHVVVDRDVELQDWTISVSDPRSNTAMYLLGRLQKISEDMLRRAAVQQYSVQHNYVMQTLAKTSDATTKATLYNILTSIDRALVVLRSGSSVATIVISEPFVPMHPTSPSRYLVLATTFLSLFVLVALTYTIMLLRRFYVTAREFRR